MGNLIDTRGLPMEQAQRAKTARMPQEICQGKPCWCGQHPDLSVKPKPPAGYQPYSAKRTKQWLAMRAKARKEAAGA